MTIERIQLWENKFTSEIECPRCGRVGTLNLKRVQLCGKKGCNMPHKGPYARILHQSPRRECYISKKLIAAGGILPHLLRKKKTVLEFRLRHRSLRTRAYAERKTGIKRSGVRTQLRQPQILSTHKMPTQLAPSVQTKRIELPSNLTERVEEQPTATFTFARDGDYVTVQHPSEPPVVVLLTKSGEFYCGGCAKTDCIHTQAVRQRLKKDDR